MLKSIKLKTSLLATFLGVFLAMFSTANAEIIYQAPDVYGTWCVTSTDGNKFIGSASTTQAGEIGPATHFTYSALGPTVPGGDFGFLIGTSTNISSAFIDVYPVLSDIGEHDVTGFGATTTVTQGEGLYFWMSTNLGAQTPCVQGSSSGSPFTNIYNNPILTTSQITAANFPLNGAVEISALVSFQYDYTVVAPDTGLTGMHLFDLTSGTVIPTASTTLMTGSTESNSTVLLTINHQYQWQPYLIINGSEYGGPVNMFSTGTSSPVGSQAIVTNNSAYGGFVPRFLPEITGTQSSSSSPSYVNWTNATTASGGIIPQILGQSFGSVLQTKWPFSYIFDFATLVSELGSGTGTTTDNDAYYSLPTGALGSHLANGSTTVKIFDTQAISNMSVVVAMKQLLGNSLYFITGVATVQQVMSAL